jgi:glycosyltransferase involved in cell wall biosynthesis
MKELAKRGHQVILIGHPDSEVRKHGISLIPKTRSDWWTLLPEGVDLIHLFYNFSPPVDIPTLNAIQGNGKIGEKFQINTVFCSKKHAENHGSQSFIHNAIDLEEFPFRPKEQQRWDDFLFLAKGSWSVKNLKGCIKACRASKKVLHIAGGRSWIPSRFLKNYGMVGGERKLEAIRAADALLFVVRWPEPFGIAIIEAMSQGLPVIGTPYGSLPELITPETGRIVKTLSELTQLISSERPAFNPEIIRKYIETRFSIEVIATQYEDIYKKILSGESLNKTAPRFALEHPAETLLPF